MIKKHFILLFALLATFGCGTSYHQQLCQIESIMTDHPDSALKLIRTIDRDDIRRRREKAKYALLYSQALDKNYIDVDNDSIIGIAYDYYSRRGEAADRAKALYYYSIVASNGGNVDRAMEALIPARIYAEKTDDEYTKGLIYSAIGSLYYDQNSMDEAARYFKMSADAFGKISLSKNQLIAYSNLGEVYRVISDHDNALYYLYKADSIARDKNDTLQILYSTLKIANIYIKKCNDYDSLENYKHYLFNTYKTYNHGTTPKFHYAALGRLYFKQNMIDSARLFLTKSLEYKNTVTNNNIGTYITLSLIEENDHNYEKSLKYRKSYNEIKDSILYENHKNIVEKLEHKYRNEYLQKSYDALEAKHRLHKICMWLIITVLLAAGGLLCYWFRNIIRKKNESIAEYNNYASDVSANYDELKEKFDELKVKMAQKEDKEHKLLRLLGNRINSLKTILDLAYISGPKPHMFITRFTNYIKVESDKDSELSDDLIAIANVLYNNVIDKMGTDYPTITIHEKCYCACICLGFSPEDVRVIFNHTNTSSIYTIRNKLRYKMGITNTGINLVPYIIAIRDAVCPEMADLLERPANKKVKKK